MHSKRFKLVSAGLLTAMLSVAACDLSFDFGEPDCVFFCPEESVPGFANMPAVVAAGSTTSGELFSAGSLNSVASSDTSLMSVERNGAEVTLVAHAAGSVEVGVFDVHGAFISSVPIEIRSITSVAFIYAPHPEQALTRLDALPGAIELVRVEARGEDEFGLLDGAESALMLSFEGSVGEGAIDEAIDRRFLDDDSHLGFHTAMRFGELGSGRLIAQTVDGFEAVLEIEVVEAIDDLALLLDGRVAVGSEITATVVGENAVDQAIIPVAGLVAEYSATPAELADIVGPSTGGSASLLVRGEGELTVRADLGGGVVVQESLAVGAR